MPTFNVTDGAAGADTLGEGGRDDTLTGSAGADVSYTFDDASPDRVPDPNVGDGDRGRPDPGSPRSAAGVTAAADGPDRVRPMRAPAERRTFGHAEDLPEPGRKLHRNLKRVGPGVQLRCEAGARTKEVVILSGWASQMQTLPDGRRQIFSLLIPGDTFLMDERAERQGRGIVALTRLTVMEAGHPSPPEGDAWRSLQRTMREAAIEKEKRLMDHMVRIGRLNARERILHLLLELYERLDAVGLVKDETFRMPLTQEVLADTLGLSAVHINRTLRQLNHEGHIRLKHRWVTLPHREKLAALTFYRPPRA